MNAMNDALGGRVELPVRLLDQLLPMHMWFGADGGILHAGPTLLKLADVPSFDGQSVFDAVEFRGLNTINSPEELAALDCERLNLRLTSIPQLQLRGQLLGLPGMGGGLINISLGVSFAEAVEQRRLTLSDFSPCDQTVELLYLREAIGAISSESRKLTDRLISAERAAQARASTDALTGLSNRRALDAALEALLLNDRPGFSIMHLDLDFFKEVNDTLGHAAGDAVLTRVARVLRDEIRENDVAARVGGDEFVLILKNCEDPVIVGRIANRLISRLEEPMTIEGQVCAVSASLGSTRSGLYDKLDPDQMLRDADVALYASKRAGRGRHTFFHEGLTSETPDAATGS